MNSAGGPSDITSRINSFTLQQHRSNNNSIGSSSSSSQLSLSKQASSNPYDVSSQPISANLTTATFSATTNTATMAMIVDAQSTIFSAAIVDRPITPVQQRYQAAPSTRTPSKKHQPSPGWFGSPTSKSSKHRRLVSNTSDRFIPDRTGTDLTATFKLSEMASPLKQKVADDSTRGESDRIYVQVLRTEIFQDVASPSMQLGSPSKFLPFSNNHPYGITPLKSSRKLNYDIFNTSKLSPSTLTALVSPRKAVRNISKIPFRVLDAPELADDFYLNVVDWSSNNTLGVGLGTSVYLWSACSSRVNKLCDVGPYDSVTSVNWIQKGSHLAIGTNRGMVQIWDAAAGKKIRTMTGHSGRVGCLAWNEHTLSTGSRDRTILHRDVREKEHFNMRLSLHKQEICGLKWNSDINQLASGGNDNKLFVWDRSTTTPLHRFAAHTAAIKAVAWSPNQHGLLASGGGTADRKIRFWNTQTGEALHSVDTGSQVCNIAWSLTTNELVSTHGYSQNQIVVWKYPTMQQVVTLTGHTYRVLYLAMSPDGQTVVTGAGDETLRFWNLFKKKPTEGTESLLEYPIQTIR